MHPGAGWGEGEGGHRLFLICDDIERTVAELESKGVEFTSPIAEEDWGLVTTIVVPGHGEIGLYEPTHPSPLETASGPENLERPPAARRLARRWPRSS